MKLPIWNKIKVFFLLLGFCCLGASFALTSCNKDDEILAEQQPVIIFDTDNGEYTLKIGEEITLRPEVKFARNARYQWIIDERVVSEAPELKLSFDRAQEVFVTFRVIADNGEAEDDILINVVEFSPPYVSLPVPEGGFDFVAGREYLLEPEFYNRGDDFSCRWLIDGKEVSTAGKYTFKESAAGTYKVSIIVKNTDGETRKDFTVKVSSVLPYKVEFPSVSYCYKTTDVTAAVGRPVCLIPEVSNIGEAHYKWYVDGIETGSDSPKLVFTPSKAGDMEVRVIVTGKPVGNASDDVSAGAKVTVKCYASEGTMRQVTGASSMYQNKVYEYIAAPGQFINETLRATGFTGNESTPEDAADYALGRLGKRLYVSLGAFGGYIVVGFDHSIRAGSGDYDFAIGGNAYDASNEPGVVWVMQDTNGNGLPDDQWYELRGSETGKPETLERYAVTYYRPPMPGAAVRWTDSRGSSGRVEYMRQYHDQPYYYPSWIKADSYTLRGTLLKARNVKDAAGYWIRQPFGWGYADNIGDDCPQKGNSANEDGEKQYNRFRISDAMLADGTAVKLSFIDFVMVQSATQGQAGPTGENSTEVTYFQDLSKN